MSAPRSANNILRFLETTNVMTTKTASSSAAAFDPESEAKRALEWLRSGPIKPRDLSMRMQIGEAQVNQVLSLLAARGLVDVDNAQLVRLSEDAEQALKLFDLR
jgi:hypothetical protein